MPLSDEERRRLEELDREFSADDPRLAWKLRSGLIQPLPAAGPLLHALGVVTALGVILMGLIGVIDGGVFVGVFSLAWAVTGSPTFSTLPGTGNQDD